MRKLYCFAGCIFLFLDAGYLKAVNIDHWETIVYAGDTWKYYVAVDSAPSSTWKDAGFDDSGWLSGPGGIGYSDGDDATIVPTCWSVNLRMTFTIADTSQIEAAILNVDYDDAFVAWLNGVEIGRANIGTVGDNPAWNAALPIDHEAVMYNGGTPSQYVLNKQLLNSCLKNGSNTLCVQVNNVNITSSDLSAIVFFSVGMKNPGMTYRSVPSWFVAPQLEGESNLPLFLIDTHGQAIPDEPKIPANLAIIDNGPGNINHVSDPPNDFNGLVGIELHGSSSQMFPKKPYGIETWRIPFVDSSVVLLGLPPENDFVLHAPYSDKSLIRNALAYYLGSRIDPWSPRTRFCELYLNNNYNGLYLLVEKVKRDSNRVNIAKLTPDDTLGNDLTGGYILKIDKFTGSASTEGWYSAFAPDAGTENPYFMYDYPKPEDMKVVQKRYIQNKINAFETALHGTNYKDPVLGYREYIDVESFVNYFIINELSKNIDGFRLSTFIYKNRDDRDPKIHAGPLWDYDLAFGNADYSDAWLTTGWQYTTDGGDKPVPFWWSKLLNDPYFTNALKCRWKYLRKGVLKTDSINNYIDGVVEKITDAANRNFEAYPILGTYVWPNPYVGNTYNDEITYLKGWIDQRLTWLDANMPGNCTQSAIEPVEETSFKVIAYPNPAKDLIRLEIQNPDYKKLNLTVYNLLGQQVLSKSLGNPDHTVETIALPAGVYQVILSDGTGSYPIKIIMQ